MVSQYSNGLIQKPEKGGQRVRLFQPDLQKHYKGSPILKSVHTGWVNYYGKFRKHEMNPIFQVVRKRIVRLARKMNKRYKTIVSHSQLMIFLIHKHTANFCIGIF